jgi:hypothetical protein
MGRRTRMFLLKPNSNQGWDFSKPNACVCVAASLDGSTKGTERNDQ